MKKIIEIQEDVKIGDVILEKGDKIEVLGESFTSYDVSEMPDVIIESIDNKYMLEIYKVGNDIGVIEVYKKGTMGPPIIFHGEDEIK